MAFNQSLLNYDKAEGRYRARLIVTLTEIHHLTEVLDAAHELET